MANFQAVLSKSLSDGHVERMFSVNRNLMEVSKATKKKPAFIKIAVDDETAMGIMNGKKLASFLLCFDGDKLNEIADELKKQDAEQQTVEG